MFAGNNDSGYVAGALFRGENPQPDESDIGVITAVSPVLIPPAIVRILKVFSYERRNKCTCNGVLINQAHGSCRLVELAGMNAREQSLLTGRMN